MITIPRHTSDPFAEARRITRTYAKSFYFASHVLPADKRDAAYAVYAFCRHADNLVDAATPGDSEAVRTRLRELRAQLERAYAGAEDISPMMRALQSAARRFDIPREYFADLLDGVAMDLDTPVYEGFDELELYCFRVASVVGLVMTHIFGFRSADALIHAAELGTAMQLTNILRDVGEDQAMGRIYLPMQELRRFGITGEDFQQGRLTPEFRSFMRFQVCRARAWYRRAEAGIPLLTDDGSRACVRLMSRIYEGILDSIERNAYDVFTQRAYVPAGTKLRLALTDYLGSRRNSGDRPALAPDTAGVVPRPPLTFHETRAEQRRRQGVQLPILPRLSDIGHA